MRIVIAGCGDVGCALGKLLVAAGHAVTGVRRRAELIPPPIEAVAADLGDPATLSGLPSDVDLLYVILTPDERTPAGYRQTYVEGVSNLLGAVGTARRVLFVSSTAVYGQTDGAWIDETSPAVPTGFRGEVLAEAERLVSDHDGSGVVMRFGGIYGPGRSRLIDSVRRGEARCRAEPPLYTNRMHRDDVAGALAHVGQLDTPARLYLGVDDDPAAQCEVMGWLAARLGAPPPNEELDGGEPRPNKRCRNDRLRATGYDLRFPTFREGYDALLA